MPNPKPKVTKPLAALLLLLPCLSWAATPAISDSQAAAHVGQHVLVEGKVVAVYTSPSGNIFLNFGAVYPRQDFSVVIFSADGGSFLNVGRYDHRRVAVSGLVQSFRGKPEIVVHSPRQLRLLAPARASAEAAGPRAGEALDPRERALLLRQEAILGKEKAVLRQREAALRQQQAVLQERQKTLKERTAILERRRAELARVQGRLKQLQGRLEQLQGGAAKPPDPGN